MATQFDYDVMRLSEIISTYTTIPMNKVENFIRDRGAIALTSESNMLCSNTSQRECLEGLFLFKSIFDNIKNREKEKTYIFRSPDDIVNYFSNVYSTMMDKEYFRVGYLNTKNELITDKLMSIGNLTQAPVDIGSIAKEALFLNARSVIVVHNHPSGYVLPSDADIDKMNRIFNVLSELGIEMLDALIIGGDDYYSFKEDHQLKDVLNYISFENMLVKESPYHSTYEISLSKSASETWMQFLKSYGIDGAFTVAQQYLDSRTGNTSPEEFEFCGDLIRVIDEFINNDLMILENFDEEWESEQ